MKTTLIYLSIVLGIVLVTTSCKKLPENLQKRKDNIDETIENINKDAESISELKDYKIVIIKYIEIKDSIIKLDKDCNAIGYKSDFNKNIESIDKKVEELRKERSEKLKDQIFGRWSVSGNGVTIRVSISDDGSWSQQSTGLLGNSFSSGTWKGNYKRLDCYDDNGFNAGVYELSDDGTELYYSNNMGSRLTYTKI